MTIVTNKMWPEGYWRFPVQGPGGLVTSAFTLLGLEPPGKEETVALLERPCGETDAHQPPAVPASSLAHQRCE